MHGDIWQETRQLIIKSLEEALGTLRGQSPRKIRLLGNSQLAYPFLIGWHCDRSTNVNLYCYNKDGNVFTNENQERFTPLRGGNPDCETKHPDIPPIPPGTELEAISLLLAPDTYVPDVVSYIKELPVEVPLKWVRSGHFRTSADVMSYIADVVDLLEKLSSEHPFRKAYIYCTLPFNMVPLLAANLLHVVKSIVFMEYRRDLRDKHPPIINTYAPLIL